MDEQIHSLKTNIEDVDAEINYNKDENAKSSEQMEFINWLIKEFRPRLAPENGLQPLSKEAVKKMEKAALKQKQALTDEKDSVFMTQEQKDNINLMGMDQPNNGDSFK